ncbi:MAG TPA: hypothetical protein VIA45_00625 [Thermoanaerobaculia bacterium]|jgi:hypothetical protein
MKRTKLLFTAFFSAAIAAAQPADHFEGKFPCPGISPGGCTLTGVFAGRPADLFVFAVEADESFDADYRGTIHVTSSDPRAILPPDHTLTSADEGRAGLTITFRTLGQQTVTITDTSGVIPALALSIAVLAPPNAIPLSGVAMILLGGLLALGGAWLLRVPSRGA